MIHHARECQRKGVVLTCKDHLYIIMPDLGLNIAVWRTLPTEGPSGMK